MVTISWQMYKNAPKCTKMDQNGNHIMTKQKCFEYVLRDLYDLLLDQMDTWKGIGVSTSHGGVIGSHIRCTKMHQNVSKRTKIDQNCGAFWCTSCVNPWPLHGLYWLLSPFKSPFYPEKDHISHSGQIRNTFALSWYSEHFGLFWSIWYIFVHFGAPHVWPHDPSMTYTDLTPIPFQESI